MTPSGLNDIEYSLHWGGKLFRFVGYVVGFVIFAPIILFFWSKDTMAYQEKAVQAVNTAPMTHQIRVDFNTCTVPPALLDEEQGVAERHLSGDHEDTWMLGHTNLLPFTASGAADTPRFMRYSLPWAPGLVNDPWLAHDREAALAGTSMGPVGSLYLTHYRNSWDIPNADPWYAHGLFKMAPTKRWDWGTGPDYVFGKCAGNYQAYASAARATAGMRFLLAGRSMGLSGHLLALSWKSTWDQDPVLGYWDLHNFAEHKPGERAAFLKAYCTNFGTALPVVTLDLQKFEESTWAPARQKESGVTWDKFMGWWPEGQRDPEEIGGLCQKAETRDFFITGLRLQGQRAWEGRVGFSRSDFLFYRLPTTSPDLSTARGTLARLLTDSFWDALLPQDPETKRGAHEILAIIRAELQQDYQFARKYGNVAFSGDKMDREPSIMMK